MKITSREELQAHFAWLAMVGEVETGVTSVDNGRKFFFFGTSFFFFDNDGTKEERGSEQHWEGGMTGLGNIDVHRFHGEVERRTLHSAVYHHTHECENERNSSVQAMCDVVQMTSFET